MTKKPASDAVLVADFPIALAKFKEQLERGRFPPLLLLTGPARVDKSAFATSLAALHVCKTRSSCGSCDECRMVFAKVHPELFWFEIDDEDSTNTSKLKLADAALLQEHLKVAAAGTARLAIIDGADRLTLQAANRLLKTLEELPPRAYVIMTTARPKAIPITLRSRAMSWVLHSESNDVLDDESDRQLQQSISRLIGHRLSAAEILSECERLAKAPGLSAEKLAFGVEGALNNLYRSILLENREAVQAERETLWYAPSHMARRRAILRELKNLGAISGVPINLQLTLEALALPTLAAEV